MPFGLATAPGTFQCVMNFMFAGPNRKYVLVFMDDILVFSLTLADHLEHLQSVFNILKENQLFVKESKCVFAQQSLEYLGHIISDKGVATDPANTEAMVQWPTPTNVTELRGFLGLTGYYRKFVRNYGLLAKPLTVILKKQAFSWSTAAQQAFQHMKEAMINTPVLALPNFFKQFVVETDACDVGIGAVLMQQDHPIAFVSRALGPRNKDLSVYEKEYLVILLAVDVG